MPENRETCFVIMPFSKTTEEHTEDYWTKHFVHFLKPLIEENTNLEAHRSEALRGDILKQIITNLVTAPIVVADLTDHNCNVYWELGIRQSFKHCTVTIAESETPIPFDLSVKARLEYYPKDHIKMQEFKKIFKQALNDCITNPTSPDSHVLETIGGRGTLFEVFRKDEARRRLEALVSQCFRNLDACKSAVKQAKVNINLRKSGPNSSEARALSSFLSLSALQLLILERYIEEDEEFYYDLQNQEAWYIWFNDLIKDWDNPLKMPVIDATLVATEEECLKKLEKTLDVASRSLETVGKLM